MMTRFALRKTTSIPTTPVGSNIKRGISTWLPTTSSGSNTTLSNEQLQFNAKSVAKHTGTTYVSPSDFRKGKFTPEQAQEPFNYIADQADIRKQGNMEGVIENHQAGFNALKGNTREGTIYSCHAGTTSGNDSRSSVLSRFLNNAMITAPKGQLKMNADEFGPFEARVGKMDTLTSPFTTFPADKSLTTVKGREVVPTPKDNALQKAITETLKRPKVIDSIDL